MTVDGELCGTTARAGVLAFFSIVWLWLYDRGVKLHRCSFTSLLLFLLELAIIFIEQSVALYNTLSE